MNIAYARTPLPKSIFLAGPTPRDAETKSWRPETIKLLTGFDGTIFVPEDLTKVSFIQEAKEWTQILYQFGLGAAALKTLQD